MEVTAKKQYTITVINESIENYLILQKSKVKIRKIVEEQKNRRNLDFHQIEEEKDKYNIQLK